jgi:hypothetical protein
LLASWIHDSLSQGPDPVLGRGLLRIFDERKVGWGNKGVMENVGLSMEKKAPERKRLHMQQLRCRSKGGEAFWVRNL